MWPEWRKVGKRPLGRPRRRWITILQWILNKQGWDLRTLGNAALNLLISQALELVIPSKVANTSSCENKRQSTGALKECFSLGNNKMLLMPAV
jgi:hypothetical protein